MSTAARSSPERIVLVVDDEELVCRLTARILADAGFHVVEARGGAEALSLLARLNGTVQLVVSDIAMPGVSGLALAERMAAEWPATPLLLVSGQGGPPEGYPGRFLPKPFTRDALLNTIAELVPMSQ